MEVSYTPAFVRMLMKLPRELQEEALEKIELFRNEENHLALKIHKLSGGLKGRYSFSVNYKTRIVFNFTKTSPKEARLDAIGDHDIYR